MDLEAAIQTKSSLETKVRSEIAELQKALSNQEAKMLAAEVALHSELENHETAKSLFERAIETLSARNDEQRSQLASKDEKLLGLETSVEREAKHTIEMLAKSSVELAAAMQTKSALETKSKA
jgi:hypothetical protein